MTDWWVCGWGWLDVSGVYCDWNDRFFGSVMASFAVPLVRLHTRLCMPYTCRMYAYAVGCQCICHRLPVHMPYMCPYALRCAYRVHACAYVDVCAYMLLIYRPRAHADTLSYARAYTHHTHSLVLFHTLSLSLACRWYVKPHVYVYMLALVKREADVGRAGMVQVGVIAENYFGYHLDEESVLDPGCVHVCVCV